MKKFPPKESLNIRYNAQDVTTLNLLSKNTHIPRSKLARAAMSHGINHLKKLKKSEIFELVKE